MTAPSEFTMSSKQQTKKKGDTATATAPRRPQPQPLRRQQQQQRQEITVCPLRAWSCDIWSNESTESHDLDGEDAQWRLFLHDDVISLVQGSEESLRELLSIAVGNDVMSITVRPAQSSSQTPILMRTCTCSILRTL